MKALKLVVPAMVISVVSGCASILTDDVTKVNLTTSNGKTTTVTIDGQEFTAPGIATVTKDGNDKVIVADSETCKGETSLPKKVEDEFYINILSGGAFGSTTDFATNKMWGYANDATVSCGE